MSAQTAIDEAEKRAKLAREEHEQSAKELDEQLAEAKVGGPLHSQHMFTRYLEEQLPFCVACEMSFPAQSLCWNVGKRDTYSLSFQRNYPSNVLLEV